MESYGLEYRKTGSGYAVAGPGRWAGTRLEIPAEHLGEPVVGIDVGAFSGCRGIVSVSVPPTMERIGGGAFAGCVGIVEVCNGSCLPIRAGDASFGEIALHAVNVCFDDGGRGRFFTTDDGFACYDVPGRRCVCGFEGMCRDLRLPDDPEGPEMEIRPYAFDGCDRIGSVTVPATVKRIGEGAFGGCHSLAEVRVPDVSAWLGIEFGDADANPLHTGARLCVGGKPLERLVIPSGAEEIRPYAFAGLDVDAVSVPSSVRRFGEDAFLGCRIGDVCLESVASWCGASFSGDGSNPLNAAERLFVGGLRVFGLEIPSGVTEVGAYAFCGCGCIASVTLPESLVSIGERAFCGCVRLLEVRNLSRIALVRGSTGNGYVACYADDVLTSPGERSGFRVRTDCFVFREGAERDRLTGYVGDSSDLELPSGVPAYDIRPYAFRGRRRLSSVVIPGCVRSVGEFAFEGCGRLESVRTEDGVTFIGDYAFSDCARLHGLEFGAGLLSIGRGAFSGCAAESLRLPDGLESIGDGAFGGCGCLDSVVIPGEVRRIGDGAFNPFRRLTVFYLGDAAGWSDTEKRACDFDAGRVRVLFYSEDKPGDGGSFWHWDSGGNPAEW